MNKLTFSSTLQCFRFLLITYSCSIRRWSDRTLFKIRQLEKNKTEEIYLLHQYRPSVLDISLTPISPYHTGYLYLANIALAHWIFLLHQYRPSTLDISITPISPLCTGYFYCTNITLVHWIFLLHQYYPCALDISIAPISP